MMMDSVSRAVFRSRVAGIVAAQQGGSPMTRRIVFLLATACVFAPAALPYVVHRTSGGATVTRPDYSNVQFRINQDFAPGLTNNDSLVVVTPDSDVMGALNAAIATWNGISTTAAQFAPVQTTAATSGQNIILMSDTPAIRSMVGPTLTANTALFVSGTTIINSEIVFNPVLTFSSTGVPKTYDLQTVFTKQLGNSLGLANGGIIGATLFIFSSANEPTKQNLSPDDIAGVSGIYPSASEPSVYGTLAGTLTQNGAPLRQALISAVDTGSGTALATLTKSTDGTWSMAAPAGNYLIYAQPLVTDPNQFGQIVTPYFVGANDGTPVDTNFQSSFLGGYGSGTTVSVTAGASSDASFSPDPIGGATQTSLLTVSAVPVGGSSPANLKISPAPVTVVSGQAYDLILQGVGIDSTLNDSSFLLLGPLSLRPGSTKQDKGPALNFNGVDYPNVRFTVDIPAVSAQTYGTLIVTNNGTFASYTGGIVITPSQ